MATRSGAEFRAGTGTSGVSEDMHDWAKSLVRNQEEFRRSQEESKAQIEFLMAQLVDLKMEKPADASFHATTLPAESSTTRAIEVREDESQWDAAKQGAELEVAVFDGSLDPKKYMD